MFLEDSEFLWDLPVSDFAIVEINDAEADFSGMTGKPRSEVPMTISQIVHRAVIEVAEEATEAAAGMLAMKTMKMATTRAVAKPTMI